MNVCGCSERWKSTLFGLLLLALFPQLGPCTHTHTHTHTQAHIAVVCAYTLTLMGRTDSCFVSLHLKKCVRLHNEADLCFLSLPLVNARLSGVEMSEFISNSLGRAELCLCVYSGRKLI